MTGDSTNNGTINGGAGAVTFNNALTSTAGSVNVGSGGLTVVSTANFTGSALNGNVGANPDLTFQGNVTFGGDSRTTVIGWCSLVLWRRTWTPAGGRLATYG